MSARPHATCLAREAHRKHGWTMAELGRCLRAVILGGAILLAAWAPVAGGGEGREAAEALGRHRTVSGLPAVHGDSGSGAQAHATYLARNLGRPEVAGLRVHEEDQALPGATAEGAATAKRSHVASGDRSASSMIDGLIGAPLHRHALMDPRLDRIAVGRAGDLEELAIAPHGPRHRSRIEPRAVIEVHDRAHGARRPSAQGLYLSGVSASNPARNPTCRCLAT